MRAVVQIGVFLIQNNKDDYGKNCKLLGSGIDGSKKIMVWE